MICEPCRKAADHHASGFHAECTGCDCQHKPTQAEIDRLTIEEDAPIPFGAHVWARYKKFDECPKCSAPTGEPCIDLRWPAKWRRTLKPHAERKRLSGARLARRKGK